MRCFNFLAFAVLATGACIAAPVSTGDTLFSDLFDGSAGAAAKNSRPEPAAGGWVGTALLDGQGRLVSDQPERGSRRLAANLGDADLSKLESLELRATIDLDDADGGWVGLGFASDNLDLRGEGGPSLRLEHDGDLLVFTGPGMTQRTGAIEKTATTGELVLRIDLIVKRIDVFMNDRPVTQGELGDLMLKDLSHAVLQFQATTAGVDAFSITGSFGDKVRLTNEMPASRAPTQGLTHGPILGRPSADGIRVWLRTGLPGRFSVRYDTAHPLPADAASVQSQTRAEQDNTGTVDLTGLKADTTYYYEIAVEGSPVESTPARGVPLSFKTWPDATTYAGPELNPEGRFNFTFGTAVCNLITGARKTAAYNNIWEHHRDELDLFIMNGDYIYEYYRRRKRPPQFTIEDFRSDYKGYLDEIPDMARLFTRTPMLFVFDDHELGPEDGTAEIGYRVDDKSRDKFSQPVLRDFGLKAWYEYCGWANYPMRFNRPIVFGTADVAAGGDLIVDPDADFSGLTDENTTNAHLHINTRNGGVYAVDEVVDDHTLRIAPPFEHDEQDTSYSVGSRNFYDFKAANAHFFVLDTRAERTQYQTDLWRDPAQRLLNETQTKWLEEGVAASDAEFIIIVSSVPWFVYHNASHVLNRVVPIEESKKEDGFAGHLYERERLMKVFDALEKPVVILTGDLHSGYAIQASDNVWEFMISPITSTIHPVESGGNPPMGGWYTPGDRTVKIKWASTYPMAYTKEFKRQGRKHGFVYGKVSINNVYPAGEREDGSTIWAAYDTPHLIVEVRDAETDAVVYAESISPLDAAPWPEP